MPPSESYSSKIDIQLPMKQGSCCSSWRLSIKASPSQSKLLPGAPQGLVLGPLLFLSCLLALAIIASLSTSMCTGLLKIVVGEYIHRGSNVHCCLLDASKAFNTADHSLLFEKLIKRNMPLPIVRFLVNWYSTQQLSVRWNGTLSRPFGTLNGVCQGGVLSPLLFSLYLDDLLVDLKNADIGCHYVGMFVGALAYADDLTLLAPSPSALRLMLQRCESYGREHGINFNPQKTQLICFGCSPSFRARFPFVGRQLVPLHSVVHLGHILTIDLNRVG